MRSASCHRTYRIGASCLAAGCASVQARRYCWRRRTRWRAALPAAGRCRTTGGRPRGTTPCKRSWTRYYTRYKQSLPLLVKLRSLRSRSSAGPWRERETGLSVRVCVLQGGSGRSPLRALVTHSAAEARRLLEQSAREPPFAGPLAKHNRLRVARALLAAAVPPIVSTYPNCT